MMEGGSVVGPHLVFTSDKDSIKVFKTRNELLM